MTMVIERVSLLSVTHVMHLHSHVRNCFVDHAGTDVDGSYIVCSICRRSIL